MFHIGWFLGSGFGIQSWGVPGAVASDHQWMRPDPYIRMAKLLEEACFDYMMFEDSLMVTDTYQNSMAQAWGIVAEERPAAAAAHSGPRNVPYWPDWHDRYDVQPSVLRSKAGRHAGSSDQRALRLQSGHREQPPLSAELRARKTCRARQALYDGE